MEPSGGGFRRRSPSDLLRRQPSVSLFLVLCFSTTSLRNSSGDYLCSRFLGHEDASGRRIDANGATRAKISGPTWLQYQAAWGTPFWPSSLHFFPSFFLMLCFFKIMIPINFQVIWTSFWSLKHQNIENRVFCQCRVNSRKIGKL